MSSPVASLNFNQPSYSTLTVTRKFPQELQRNHEAVEFPFQKSVNSDDDADRRLRRSCKQKMPNLLRCGINLSGDLCNRGDEKLFDFEGK